MSLVTQNVIIAINLIDSLIVEGLYCLSWKIGKILMQNIIVFYYLSSES